jgi:hypothetical protein
MLRFNVGRERIWIDRLRLRRDGEETRLVNTERACEAHDTEQRADTEPTDRGAQVMTEQGPAGTQCEREDRRDSGETMERLQGPRRSQRSRARSSSRSQQRTR